MLCIALEGWREGWYSFAGLSHALSDPYGQHPGDPEQLKQNIVTNPK